MASGTSDYGQSFYSQYFPGWSYLGIYGVTGLLAGTAAAPIHYNCLKLPYQHEFSNTRLGVRTLHLSPPTAAVYIRNTAPTFIFQTGIRFFAFGQFKWIRDVKREMGTNTWPKWVDFGVCGAAAGVFETVVINRVMNPTSGLPPMISLVRHPAKLFCCFGTFGFLTTNLERSLPPDQGEDTLLGRVKEDWKILRNAILAGGFGTGVCAAVEGLKGRALWVNAVPSGAATVGAIISCQVISCGELLRGFGASQDSDREL